MARKAKASPAKARRVFGVPLLVNVQQTGESLPPAILKALVYLRTQCLDQVTLPSNMPFYMLDANKRHLWAEEALRSVWQAIKSISFVRDSRWVFFGSRAWSLGSSTCVRCWSPTPTASPMTGSRLSTWPTWSSSTSGTCPSPSSPSGSASPSYTSTNVSIILPRYFVLHFCHKNGNVPAQNQTITKKRFQKKIWMKKVN